jgi:protein ECT2
MDPVQRIPRYTLMFRTMIKHMDPGDPQRQKLVLADEIASKIALAEADEQTKQAAIWYCLSATVDGFPPGIISNSRRFIDCVDVEDVASDPTVSLSVSGSTTSSAGSLHCTLFLFDDKLVIAKRPGNGEKSGRALTGLDEMEKLTKAGGLPAGMKKSGMTFKGVVDVTDVVAADVSGTGGSFLLEIRCRYILRFGITDMHFYLENPPQGQSDRWSGRSFRAFSVVHPPSPVNFDPTRSEVDKVRFLENLWNAQATYRTKAGQSVVLSGEETEVESRGGRVTLARTYFNVYQRKAFLQESKKVSLHWVPTFWHCIRLTVALDQNCCTRRLFRFSRSHPVRNQWPTVCSCSSPAYCWRTLSIYGHVQRPKRRD